MKNIKFGKMKDIKSGRWDFASIPDFPLRLRFKFTDAEMKQFEMILKKFNKDKVRGFITFVSSHIPIFAFLKSASFPKHDIEKDMLPDLKQCRVTLERILRGFNPNPQTDFDSMRDQGETLRDLALEAAKRVYPYIIHLEKIFKYALAESKRKRGRPQADKTGFVCEIARQFELILGRKPSMSKNGVFYKFISNLFFILYIEDGENPPDVSRRIQRALGKIRSHPFPPLPSVPPRYILNIPSGQ